ncbi:carboxylesterase/lipase family protein [Herbiconiux ginsengi]|uniref:Carboxylic ester hydrolase n=1 Tax=Herbiconiux ginsengi TaxID=381665 RepID=A0A1H3L2G6_9MICO|nr:carboxylesterase/lipase family protein [Herbiconiux ginsengi]SDY58075.1 para-nitrobenzyl esterase [Herbiconiux ginsengi]
MAAMVSTDVRVTGGVVRGVREGETIAWRGIPYAAPPVGALRFRSPHPVVAWSGRRDASAFGRVATQVYRGQFTGTPPGIPSGEDCLTVNVVSPARARNRSMPVMVFIHGGGYSAGSSREFTGQGESFVRTGQVVYVSFNYRLGALGYLDFSRYSTRRRLIESNLGLRDQVAALRWVHRNIAAFGGDPRNVTVFGESAGGNAVTTLMATPSARGLFARAIAQSSPPSAVYHRELAATWAAEFVDVIRRRRNDRRPGALSDDEVVALLSEAPASELVAAALSIQATTPDAHPGTFCLAPVVDGRFLPRHPLRAFRTGRIHRVPLIIGTNDREGAIFRGRIDILPRSPARIDALFSGAPEDARSEMHQAYPGLPGHRSAADFAGDFAFWYPSVTVADFHSRYAPVHCYRFDVAPRLMKWVGLDATHGLEMYALFDQADARLGRAMTALGGRKPFSSAGERMRDSWLHFAASGTLPESWPSYGEQDRRTMIIADSDRVEADPRPDRRQAWTRFMPLG